MICQNVIIANIRRKTARRHSRALLLSCAAILAFGCAPVAGAQIDQSLNYDFSAFGPHYSLFLDHSLSSVEVGILDVNFSQSTGYDLTEGKLDDYNVSVDINDEENFFGSLSGVYGSSFRNVSGFADNRFEVSWASIGVSAGASVDWTESTFEDEGWEDPDFDPYDYTEEELSAIVWTQSYSTEGSFQVEGNRYSIGRLKVRPGTQGGVFYSDYSGLEYNGAVGVGLSLAAADEDDEFDLFFEESNLTVNVPGGSYGGGDGELVLGAGYDSNGIGRIAALIFKGFSPSDRVDLSFDAVASAQFGVDQPFAFHSGALRVGADFHPHDRLSINNSAKVEFMEDFTASYYVDSSLGFKGFDVFSPSVRFSASYDYGALTLSLPVGIRAVFSDYLEFSADISPTYQSGDNSTDVTVSGGVTLTGPPLTAEAWDSSFSLSGSAGLFNGDRSVTLSGTVNF